MVSWDSWVPTALDSSYQKTYSHISSFATAASKLWNGSSLCSGMASEEKVPDHSRIFQARKLMLKSVIKEEDFLIPFNVSEPAGHLLIFIIISIGPWS